MSFLWHPAKIKLSLSLSLSLSSRLKYFVPFTPVLLGALVLAVVFPITSKLAPVSATIDGDIYSLSLETSNSIELTLNPSTAGALSVAKDTVTGSTSSPSGYRLYVSTASNSNDIRLNDDNIIRATSATYNAPAALSLTTAQNAVWGYAIPAAAGFSQASVYETPTSPDFINAKFATMPTADNGQLILELGTAGNAKVNVYYGVKANLGLSSGNYQGTIRYIAVSDATDVIDGEAKIALGSDTPSDNIELNYGYEATTATITTSLNTNLDLSTNTNTTITISNTSHNSTCSNPTISQATGTAVISCTIPAGLAGGTYDVDITIAKGIHNFHYSKAGGVTVRDIRTLADIQNMQEINPDICENTTIATSTTGTYQLKDTRDNTTYTVAKLDDGNCWMTQNLTLGSDTLGEIILTSADSDVSSDFTLSTPTTTSFSTSNVVNYRNYTSNSTNYYNWYTATAGTGTQSTAAYTAATSSICPKGWRLPNGSPASNVAGEWAELFYAAGITSTLVTNTSSVSYATGGATKRAAAPYNIPNTYGYFNTTGTAPTSTSYTYFWTNRTYSSTSYAWSTYMGSSSIYPNYYGSKYIGYPVRCVAHKAETKPTITYNANGGTGAPSPTMASTNSEFSQPITLSSTAPTKSGQSFAGWNTKQDGSGSWYRLGDTITTASDTTLYAIWWTETTTFDSAFAAASKTKQDGYYKMQDMNSSICNNVTQSPWPVVASSTQLIDTRDNKIYWVAKLKDGHCWMTQNLDLDLSTSKALTPDDSNVSTNWTPTKSTITTSSSTVSGWTNDSSIPYSVDRGSYYLTGGGPSSLNAINCTATNNGGENCHYHIGNHYNWTAALAKNDLYSVSKTQYTNPVSTSICPKGWRLPTAYGGNSSTNGEFEKLNIAYGNNTSNDNTLRAEPLFFARSGSVYSKSLNVGSSGYYWSSTVYSGSYAYDLLFDSLAVRPTDVRYPTYGYAVRCVAR